MNESEHTPLPWVLQGALATHFAAGKYLVVMDIPRPYGMTAEEWRANIALADKAINSHDRLVEVARDLLSNAELFNRDTDETWIELRDRADAILAEIGAAK